MYKLTKTFVSKWKQQKGKDLGGGVRKDAGLGGARVQEGDEYAPLKMSRTVHEQVKQFKVSLAHSLAQSVTHSLLLPSSTHPLTRSICHPLPPSSLQHTLTHSLNLSPIPSFFPPAHAHSLAQSVTHSLILPSSTRPLTRLICHPFPPSSLQHTPTHSLNLSPTPSFFPPAHAHSLTQSVTHSLLLPSRSIFQLCTSCATQASGNVTGGRCQTSSDSTSLQTLGRLSAR